MSTEASAAGTARGASAREVRASLRAARPAALAVPLVGAAGSVISSQDAAASPVLVG